jgi:gentisate 1,2-dioxygenase
MTPAVPRPDAALIADLEVARYHPLWDRYKAITPVVPAAKDAPMRWRWRDFEGFAARAAREVPIEDVERRAIIMAHPAFGGATVTTGNLLGAFTVLNPGDRAVPHRHTASAIRFATRAEGAATIVNGRRCAMREGDLVLTPPMCWHGHINLGHERTAWFDAANMPLVCHLDASFFEPGSRAEEKFWEVDEGDERLWTGAALASLDDAMAPAMSSGAPATSPASPASAAGAYSPKFHYPGTVTRALLDAATPTADGAKTLRYVNPASGGPVMPALDCYATRLAGGAATRARRGTWNAICLVVAGSGRSTVGETAFSWEKHDVFTVPHWTWTSHLADAGGADLFVVTDRSVYDLLGLLREEAQ